MSLDSKGLLAWALVCTALASGCTEQPSPERHVAQQRLLAANAGGSANGNGNGNGKGPNGNGAAGNGGNAGGGSAGMSGGGYAGTGGVGGGYAGIGGSDGGSACGGELVLEPECQTCAQELCPDALAACGPECQALAQCASERCGFNDLTCILSECSACISGASQALALNNCFNAGCSEACEGLANPDPVPPPDGSTSCDGFCGGFTGSCYCDDACESAGDCCEDKIDLCGAAPDPGPQPEPPPDGGSTCEGFCGGWAGSCYCDDACESYGDCCEDKVDLCGAAPEPGPDPVPPPDGGSTCEGFCGGFAGSCYCDDVCESAGDCCADKIDVCGAAPEPQPEPDPEPMPPPDGGTSCVGLCGGSTGACFCDDACESYGDCCEDKVDVCGSVL